MIKAGYINRSAWCILLICLVLYLLNLMQPGTTLAQQTDATDAREASSTAPLTGIFITSLHDLDTVNGSFGVDYWVWTIHPEERRNPLESMELFNAEEVDTTLAPTVNRDEVIWSQRKVSATIRQDWDLTNFPFDRHVLDIVMEEGIDEATTLTYRPDTANSGYSKDIELQGWRITDFELTEHTVHYASTFGDPAHSADEGSNYSRLVASMELERQSTTIFFRLIVAACVAVGISLLAFLMLPTDGDTFAARITVLVGALFATVISMQVGQQMIGTTQRVSLVDKVHIVAMVYIFAAVVITLISRKFCTSGATNVARWWDRLSLLVFGSSFVAVIGALIAVAMSIG